MEIQDNPGMSMLETHHSVNNALYGQETNLLLLGKNSELSNAKYKKFNRYKLL